MGKYILDLVLYLIRKVKWFQCFLFKNGKPGGIHRGYYPDGSLEYEGSRKNGEIHGKYIKYYFGGQTEMTGQFKRGIYNGKWKYYDVNGNLSMEKKYIRGSLIDSITY